MNTLIIEPHGDDALFSCFDILDKAPESSISIFTLSDHRSSEGLKKYFKSVGYATYVGIDNVYYPNGKVVLKTHQVHRDYVNGVPIFDNYRKFLYSDEFEYSKYVKIAEDQIKDIVKDILFKNKYDLVITNLGLSHPFHIATSKAVTEVSDIPVLYMVDKPYISNRYNKELYENFLKTHTDMLEINPGYYNVVGNDKIEKILRDVYPTEVKLLRFSSDVLLYGNLKYCYNKKYHDTIMKFKKDSNLTDWVMAEVSK